MADWTPPEAANAWTPPEAKGDAQAIASAPPAWHPPEAQQDTVQKLISDPKFDPAQYAIQTGDKETAFQARQAIDARTAGQKLAAVGQTLTEPATYGNALAGAGKFAAGLVTAPLHGLAQQVATIGAPIAGAVGADNLQHTLENEQQTEGAESTLAGQRVEEGLRATGRAVQNFSQDHPVLASAANPLLSVLPQPAPATEQDQRARFDAEIQAAKNAQQLQQQQPLNTGAVAAAAKLATGTQNLQDVYSPNALAIQGARQVNPFLTESMAAAGDPTNLAIPLAGEIPGVKTIAGGLVQAGGKLLQVPESIMGLVPKVAKLAKVGEGTATASTLGALGYSALNHPAGLAAAGGAYLLGKTLGFAGRALEEQGGALRAGIPSALDQSAQSALSAGQSAIGTNIQRGIGNAANNIVSTALGFAPVNAVLADGDPRKFVQNEIGAGAMGGIFGLAGERGRMQDIANYRLAQYGAQQFTENPMWQAHQDAMSKFSPQDQQAINALRGTLYGGTGTDVLVLDGQNFAKQVGQIGGNARGQFAADPNNPVIYLNADAIGQTPGEKAGKTLDAAGHETGHAVVDFLKNAGREGDAQNLFQSISSNLTPEQTQAITDAYHGKLLDSTDLTGKSPQEIDAIKQKIATDNPPEKILEENLAEITRRLLTGKNIGSFALPKPAFQSVMYAASRFMEARGWMPAVDPDASLNFKAQMVREAARRMNDVLYETGKTASAKANEGPSATQQLIDAKNRLAALPEITPDMPMSKARAIARQRDQAQKDLNEVQGILNPEQEQPAGTPTTPAQPESLKLNRFRIAAILRQQGLSQSEAKQWADAANGSTDEEAVVDALKQRANQKFPNTPTTQPVPQPVAKPQPIAQPIQTNERPIPASQESEPLPTGGGGTGSGAGGNTQTVKPVEVPAKDAPPIETEIPVVHTKEDFESIAAKARNDFLSDKALAKAGKNKGQHTAKNQELSDKAAFDAAAQAHAESTPSNYAGIKQRVDAFGKKSVSGNLDPSRPFDSWLIDQAQKSGNLPGDALETLQKLQSSIGKTVTYDYGHAPVAEEGEQPTQESRATQQAKNTVKSRLSGGPIQTEAKTSIPLGIQFNPGNKSFSVFGASPEKLLNNFNHVSDALQSISQKSPYRDINDPQLVADIKGVIRNHQNGWQGDGSRPAVGTAEYPNNANPEWAKSPERAVIPEDRFDFVNMMMGDEGAKAGTPQAKAKAHLANENRTLINEAGETNELRQKINDSIPWKDKNGNDASWSSVNLEDPLNENISPALASNVREASQSDESIRQHGKVGDLGRLFQGGRTPDRSKTAAGFLPNSGTPGEDPIESPKDQARSESPQGGLSQPGASKEDTGKPEDGETPSERLMREAEQAGVSVSLDTMKGMMRNDTKAMAKVRMMIRDRTGKDARFMPSDLTPLWRAADDPEARFGAHFSTTEDDAKSYLNNPGFGGGNVLKYNVDASRTASAPTISALAQQLEPFLNDNQREWADENGGLASAIRGYGFDHVFHALENSFGPKSDKIDPIDILKKAHDWIKFRDDFPEGATTYKYIGDSKLNPEGATGDSPNKTGRPASVSEQRVTRRAPEEYSGTNDSASGFMPSEKYDPNSDKSPVIDEGQPAWINRFEQLYQKDARGGLTPKEDDELDALHQRIDTTYGSLNTYDRERQKQGLPRISMTTQDMAKRRLMAA